MATVYRYTFSITLRRDNLQAVEAIAHFSEGSSEPKVVSLYSGKNADKDLLYSATLDVALPESISHVIYRVNGVDTVPDVLEDNLGLLKLPDHVLNVSTTVVPLNGRTDVTPNDTATDYVSDDSAIVNPPNEVQGVSASVAVLRALGITESAQSSSLDLSLSDIQRESYLPKLTDHVSNDSVSKDNDNAAANIPNIVETDQNNIGNSGLPSTEPVDKVANESAEETTVHSNVEMDAKSVAEKANVDSNAASNTETLNKDSVTDLPVPTPVNPIAEKALPLTTDKLTEKAAEPPTEFIAESSAVGTAEQVAVVTEDDIVVNNNTEKEAEVQPAETADNSITAPAADSIAEPVVESNAVPVVEPVADTATKP
ncbi:hypothetical protein H4S08_003851, partial [Coemansia sp. RSA 1365]